MISFLDGEEKVEVMVMFLKVDMKMDYLMEKEYF